MRIVPIFIFSLFFGVSAGGCKGKKADANDKAKKPVPVQIMKLKPRAISRTLSFDTDVRASLEVKVFSQVPERILSMPVTEGDSIKRGQVIAVIKADTLSDSFQSASAALDAALVDRDHLKSELARQKKLLAKRIIAQAAIDQLEARLASAEAQIKRMQALANQAQTVKSNAIIRSPIDGVIGQRFLDLGDMALPSLPICTVIQMDSVELIVDVPEQELADIRKGMTAMVSVARFPERQFQGVVQRIFPTIDLKTRTAQVKVVIDNPKHQLIPGMLARVRLVTDRHENTVVVPYSSLIIEMGQGGQVNYRAYILENKRAFERSVTPGIIDGDWVEVTEGLKTGQVLVTRGQHLLNNDREVDIVDELKLHDAPHPARPSSRAASNEAPSKAVKQ